MNQQMLYFAYGSNLKHQQMESRCPGYKDCNLEMEYLIKILRKQNYNIKSF